MIILDGLFTNRNENRRILTILVLVLNVTIPSEINYYFSSPKEFGQKKCNFVAKLVKQFLQKVQEEFLEAV